MSSSVVSRVIRGFVCIVSFLLIYVYPGTLSRSTSACIVQPIIMVRSVMDESNLNRA